MRKSEMRKIKFQLTLLLILVIITLAACNNPSTRTGNQNTDVITTFTQIPTTTSASKFGIYHISFVVMIISLIILFIPIFLLARKRIRLNIIHKSKEKSIRILTNR